ncbi:transposase [Desulfitobacterium sp.]|uniref:transposase n=1 Tax=Desulfitobacterium sp. TaxID=49981 RepID=UPI002CC02D36|nr:transposase [Desulfitobacterium sp.]HVJ50058.1 transposase [Desulfitobacterium sp.]
MGERKRYPKELKGQVLRETQEVGNAVLVVKQHGINVKVIYRWIRETKHKPWDNVPSDAKKIVEYLPSPKEFRQLEEENEKLKTLLGEKDLEIAICRVY